MKPVLIVGAGPTGLMMALMLRRYRVPYRIVDKKEGITSHSKALGMHARTLEVFRDLQIAQIMIAHGNPIQHLELYKGDRKLATVNFGGLDTEYPYILSIAQSETEQLIAEVLKQQGIEIAWNTEVVGVDPHEDRVNVTLSHQGTISHEVYSWVIGCDGLHGVVRDHSDIPFIGTSDDERFVVADVHMEHGINRSSAHGIIAKDSNGMVLLLPFGKERTRVVLDQCHLKDPTVPSLEYIRRVVKERLGEDVQMNDLTWSSVFHIQYKQATLFSKGRCFLAGDAAHVHSPIGGQGMNTGLQDAYNLAWKLALVYHGKSHPVLLNTYHEERSVNAKRLLRITKIMTKIGVAAMPLLQFLRPHIIHCVFGRKKFHDKMVFKLSQLQVNYKKMSLSREYLVCPVSRYGRAFRRAPHAGERVVDQTIQVMNHPEYKTFCDYLSGTSFHLVVFLTEACISCGRQLAELTQVATDYLELKKGLVIYNARGIPKERWSGGVLLDPHGTLHQRYGALKPCMYLIRPDKYIGMRSSTIDAERLRKYLQSIFL